MTLTNVLEEHAAKDRHGSPDTINKAFWAGVIATYQQIRGKEGSEVVLALNEIQNEYVAALQALYPGQYSSDI